MRHGSVRGLRPPLSWSRWRRPERSTTPPSHHEVGPLQINSEFTLGGYFAKHERAPAFEGSDGEAYSVAIWIDEEPDDQGRLGASLLFVRWSPAGDRPLGTVETPPLAWGRSAEEADARIKALSLYDVKAALDAAIASRPVDW